MTIFTDTAFKAEWNYIDPKMPKSVQNKVKWMRPHEINPEAITKPVILDGLTFEYGRLDNGNFASALTFLYQTIEVLEQCVGSFVNSVNKATDIKGKYWFKLWQDGEFKTIEIDDRLPTLDGKPMFITCNLKNIFWPALLEKAYAKLYGCYVIALSMNIADIMVDLSGGISQKMFFKDEEDNGFIQITEALKNGSLLCCHLDQNVGKICKKVLYMIMGATTVEQILPEDKLTEEKMIIDQIGNDQYVTEEIILKLFPLTKYSSPIGNWLADSEEWKFVEPEEIERLQPECKEEFWMSLKSLGNYINDAFICHFANEGVCSISDSWIKGSTDGGCRNNHQSFIKNHQYLLNLEEDDVVVISLLHCNLHSVLDVTGIGCSIYGIASNQERTNEMGSDYSNLILSEMYAVTREVTVSLMLKAGTYCIIPTTFEPEVSATFLLRIFTSFSKIELKTLGSCVQTNMQKFQPATDELNTYKQMKKQFNDLARNKSMIDQNGAEIILKSTLTPEILPSKQSIRTMINIFETAPNMLSFKDFFALYTFYNELQQLCTYYKDADVNIRILNCEISECFDCLDIKVKKEDVDWIEELYGSLLSIDTVVSIIGRVHYISELYNKFNLSLGHHSRLFKSIMTL